MGSWFLALSYGLLGLVLLRLRDERTENKIRRTLDIVERFGPNLYGRLVVISDAGVRVRRPRGRAHSVAEGGRPSNA